MTINNGNEAVAWEAYERWHDDFRVVEYLSWYFDHSGDEAAYRGTDALHGVVVEAKLDDETGDWVIVEGLSALLNARFRRVDELEVLSDAVYGATRGDEACRCWLGHYDLFKPLTHFAGVK